MTCHTRVLLLNFDMHSTNQKLMQDVSDIASLVLNVLSPAIALLSMAGYCNIFPLFAPFKFQ